MKFFRQEYWSGLPFLSPGNLLHPEIEPWSPADSLPSELPGKLSHVQLFVTIWTAACQTSLFFTISQSLLKLMSIESVMPSNHLILCRPLLLPSIFPSIRVFFNESALRIRWPKYWSSSFNSCPSNEYWGLISFRMDWLDPLGSFYNTGIGRLSNQGFSSPLPQWSCFTNIRRLLAQFTVSHGLGGHGRGLWRFPMSCSLLCTILEPRSPLGNFCKLHIHKRISVCVGKHSWRMYWERTRWGPNILEWKSKLRCLRWPSRWGIFIYEVALSGSFLFSYLIESWIQGNISLQWER